MKSFIGYGETERLKEILREHSPNHILLVTGKSSYEDSGAKAKIDACIAGYQATRFSDFDVNPRVADAEKGLSQLGGKDIDLVIAVGGGSVIDTAKLIALFHEQSGRSEDYVLGQKAIQSDALPIVAIPTTAGSGSEATHFAVVYIDKTKFSVAHASLRPQVAIVDPTFTLNMPSALTACSGVDALCQAIESYWCVNSTEESKDHSREAIGLVFANLAQAVKGGSEDSRLAMARASHLAGEAINITKTTAPHAVSYTFTSYYGIPHGHAVALTLAEFLVHNSEVSEDDVCDKRGANYVRQMLVELMDIVGVKNAANFRDRFSEFLSEIGLSARLSELGISAEEASELVVANVNVERLKNNPRTVSREQLKEIVLRIGG